MLTGLLGNKGDWAVKKNELGLEMIPVIFHFKKIENKNNHI